MATLCIGATLQTFSKPHAMPTSNTTIDESSLPKYSIKKRSCKSFFIKQVHGLLKKFTLNRTSFFQLPVNCFNFDFSFFKID